MTARLPLHMREYPHLVALDASPPLQLRYGEERDQVADLRLPAASGPHPVVVLIHGGFWSVPWDRSLMNALAVDLAARGVATWNIEYARIGGSRGGWPGTFSDVSKAVDALAGMAIAHALDLTRLATVGHSAGGHLALWAAARGGLPAGTPGAGPTVAVSRAVSLAGVLDLATADQNNVGGGAVAALLGGHAADRPDRYRLASPIELLPLGVSQLLVHGSADDVVPPSMSVAHHAAATVLGDDCGLRLIAGEDHMQVVTPGSAAWGETLTWLADAGIG